MIMRYRTKRDTNGNRYYLTVDHEKRTYKKEYNLYINDNDIEVTKRDRLKIADQLEANGYKEV